MPVWQEKRGWRYRFRHQGVMYRNTKERNQPAYYPTKGKAKAAEAEHRKELKQPASTPTGMDFREVANEYLDFCKRRWSEKNYRGKIFVYRQFQNHAPLGAFRDIGARDLESYLSILPRNTNYNRHRKALCALFSWAFKRGLIGVNPCVYVSSMPEEPKRKKIPSQEEMIKILLAAGEHRPFFLALYSLAARLGEINNLRWEDVNFEKRIVTLWTKKGRTGEWRPQPKGMNEELYEELFRLYNKRAGEYVFPNLETGLPYRNRRAQIRQACCLAGVPYYPWHTIRHHVASLLSDTHKQSLPTIQKMLGHQNLTTTQRYIQSLGEGVREAADLLKIEKLPKMFPKFFGGNSSLNPIISTPRPRIPQQLL